MQTYQSGKLVHAGFEIGLLFKGINAIFEIIGGILMIFLNPQRLNRLLLFFTRPELSEDPRDSIAAFILNIGHQFSISTQFFSIIYLLSHGIVKLLLIFLLRKKMLWAYPLSILFLFFFIFYQLYRFSFTHSVFMIFLTVLDIFMIFLTWMEYRRLQSDSAPVS